MKNRYTFLILSAALCIGQNCNAMDYDQRDRQLQDADRESDFLIREAPWMFDPSISEPVPVPVPVIAPEAMIPFGPGSGA